MPTAEEWIDALDLRPHPEGGWYREVYRASGSIPQGSLPGFGGDRSYATSIYYLLQHGQRSALHRIKQDELWHFHDGHPLEVHALHPDGRAEVIRLGLSVAGGESPQGVVPAGAWFGAAHPEETPEGAFTLVGCTVAPGFDFEDFEMATRASLLEQYPQHGVLICKLT